MFGWFKKRSPPPDSQPSRSSLVPRIKNLNFTAALKGMGIPADQLPFTEPLVADLLVTYAFDLPAMFQMASLHAISEVGVQPADVRAVAVANLKQQLPEIGHAEHGAFQRILTGEHLEACVLLAESFWNHVAAGMQGEVVAAVPSRDVLLFCDSKSADGIAALRSMAAGVYREAGTHALTEQLLVWREGRWAALGNP